MAWTHEISGPVLVFSEVTLNDSDKTLTGADFPGSPDNVAEIKIIGIRVEMTTDATASNRGIEIQLLNSTGDIIGVGSANSQVTPSETKIYEFIPGAPGVANGETVLPSLQVDAYATIPYFYMSKGMSLRIWDSLAIAPAGDDMIVHVRAEPI